MRWRRPILTWRLIVLLACLVLGAVASITVFPTSHPTSSDEPVTRDALKQPFASSSIWNMPIGDGAVYVPANLPAVPGGNKYMELSGPDREYIFLDPTAPMTDIHLSTVGWSGGDRCVPTGPVIATVPIPADFTVPNRGRNHPAAFLMPDGRTIEQAQPFTRCSAGGPVTSLVASPYFPQEDLYGDGITGAHGGSGLSAIGGSLRVGELRPGDTGPRHSLKLNLRGKESLAMCDLIDDCHRWPATKSDQHATDPVIGYGRESRNSNAAMRMGALLAIPAYVDLNSLELETEPAREMAWTLQNYGTYVVDDSFGGYEWSLEESPSGSFLTQFHDDYGFPFDDFNWAVADSPWSRDLQRMYAALFVVDNNSPSSIGGGGKRRQPLAPPITPP